MANLTTITRQLRDERNRVQRELERLDAAISALARLDSRGAGRRPRRRMSAAARRRIAAAQRARWAKLKRGKKPA